jgi:pimeloyl-ACP methyl ester carboxylesterase
MKPIAGLIGLVMAFAIASSVHAAPAFTDHYANDDGVKIHYVAAGHGPLVVMIHGFPDYWGTWKPLMKALDGSYRVVAMDLRGYNLSDKPEGVEAYAFPHLIADVAAVIKAEGQSNAIIIGHDWGAAISWQLAMTRPDLVGKLIIMSVPHPAGFAREMATDKAQQTGSQYARNFQTPGFEKNLSPEMLAGMHGPDPAVRAEYTEAFKRSDIGDMLNYYRANYPKTTDGGGVMGAPITPINVPVLVIHGMKDTALRADGHAGVWNYVTADTTVLMIPNAGHWVQHDAEGLVDRTVHDWLDARR